MQFEVQRAYTKCVFAVRINISDFWSPKLIPSEIDKKYDEWTVRRFTLRSGAIASHSGKPIRE